MTSLFALIYYPALQTAIQPMQRTVVIRVVTLGAVAVPAAGIVMGVRWVADIDEYGIGDVVRVHNHLLFVLLHLSFFLL